MKTTLSTLAVTATTSIDNVLLLLAKELEAHKELIEKLETQIMHIQEHNQGVDRDGIANDHSIDARFNRIEARLDMIEKVAQGTTHSITDDIETRFEHLRSKVESVEYAAQNSLGEVHTLLSRLDGRLDDVESSIETGITYSDIDERFTEALQNVTFTVTVD
jgi:hypothetical protein